MVRALKVIGFLFAFAAGLLVVATLFGMALDHFTIL